MKRLALIILVAATVIGFAMAFATLGIERTLRIAAAAVLTTVVDGQVEHPGPMPLPVFNIELDKSDLAALNRDLPWSGGDAKTAVMHHAGSTFPVKFRYRGSVVTSHYLGAKRSFRVTLDNDGPFGRIRRMNFINPKTPDMLNVYMGLWVARSMQVAVPFDDFAFVRINGHDVGVMEMAQQIDGSFGQGPEDARHEVPVFKGDYPSITGRTLPERRYLWKDARHWSFVGLADSIAAGRRLDALIDVIRDGNTAVILRDTLPHLLDMEAYLRYTAALKVLGTGHIDNYHNQWLVQRPEDSLLFPVLWDPLMLFPTTGEPWYPVHDALAFRVLSEPRWRVRRDRNIWLALTALHRDGAFAAEFRGTLDRIRTAVMADRNKCTGVTANNMDVFPYSMLHFANTAERLQRDVAAYWDRLDAQCAVRDARLRPADQALRISFSGVCAIRLEWSTTTGDAPVPSSLPSNAWMDRSGDRWLLTIAPTVVHRGIGAGSAFADKTWLEPAPVDLTITFPNGTPPGVQVFNAVTDAPVHPQLR